MALQRLVRTERVAKTMGPGPEELQEAKGILLQPRYHVGKWDKIVWRFRGKDGKEFDVWGNTSINYLLTDETGLVKKEYLEKWVEIKFTAMGDSKDGQCPQKMCDVYIDLWHMA